MYNTIPQISTELHFLKAQISLASGDPLEVGLNMVQTSVLSSAAHLPNAWQVCHCGPLFNLLAFVRSPL